MERERERPMIEINMERQTDEIDRVGVPIGSDSDEKNFWKRLTDCKLIWANVMIALTVIRIKYDLILNVLRLIVSEVDSKKWKVLKCL